MDFLRRIAGGLSNRRNGPPNSRVGPERLVFTRLNEISLRQQARKGKDDIWFITECYVAEDSHERERVYFPVNGNRIILGDWDQVRGMHVYGKTLFFFASQKIPSPASEEERRSDSSDNETDDGPDPSEKDADAKSERSDAESDSWDANSDSSDEANAQKSVQWSILKAEIQQSGKIIVTHISDVEEDEYGSCHQSCNIRKRNGMIYATTICEPDNEIHIDVPESELEDLELECVHRNRMYFVEKDLQAEGYIEVKLRDENIIVIKAKMCTIFSHGDSSPFLYLTNRTDYVCIFDTQSMMILREFTFNIEPGILWEIVSCDTTDIYATVVFDFNGHTKRLMVANIPELVGGSEKKIEKGFKSNFLEKYEIRSIIGEGTFGVVFEAVYPLDNQVYAVKRIHTSVNRKKKALDEVRVLATMQHEGIVRYRHVWDEEPEPEGWQKNADAELLRKLGRRKPLEGSDASVFIYVQMEFCEQNLRQWLDKTHERHPHHAKFVLKQLLSAVEYIHRHNLIHRDLKPNNILVVHSRCVKICDLGLVASRGQDDCIIRTWMTGTPMYMAPEQYQDNYTNKVDIFALGLIFVELSVKMTVHEAREIFLGYQAGLLQPPTATLEHLPEVDQFVSKLTQKDPKLRPDCKEILKDPFLA